MQILIQETDQPVHSKNIRYNLQDTYKLIDGDVFFVVFVRSASTTAAFTTKQAATKTAALVTCVFGPASDKPLPRNLQ